MAHAGRAPHERRRGCARRRARQVDARERDALVLVRPVRDPAQGAVHREGIARRVTRSRRLDQGDEQGPLRRSQARRRPRRARGQRHRLNARRAGRRRRRVGRDRARGRAGSHAPRSERGVLGPACRAARGRGRRSGCRHTDRGRRARSGVLCRARGASGRRARRDRRDRLRHRDVTAAPPPGLHHRHVGSSDRDECRRRARGHSRRAPPPRTQCDRCRAVVGLRRHAAARSRAVRVEQGRARRAAPRLALRATTRPVDVHHGRADGPDRVRDQLRPRPHDGALRRLVAPRHGRRVLDGHERRGRRDRRPHRAPPRNPERKLRPRRVAAVGRNRRRHRPAAGRIRRETGGRMTSTDIDFVYNPFEFATQHNPYPVYARMRDDAPVYHNAELGFYALSRHADVLAAHKDPTTFVSSHGVTLEGGEAGQELLITKDPPEHEWHRKVVSRVFTPRRVNDLEAFMRRYCGVLLDRFRDDPGFDIVEQFSIQLPLEVIGELLGIPADQRQEVHVLADRMFTRGDDVVVSDDAAGAMLELGLLLYGVVVERRKDLGDDVISLLIRSEVTDDDGRAFFLTDEQVASRILELAFAGHETVARLIANGVVALAWYPDQRRELAADADLLPNAVEEMLRWDAPSHYQGRWTSEAVTLHDVTIPADQRVILVTGAANHDDRVYEEPELFDLHRSMDGTVSFGYGVHFCLGAALARLETRVAFDELLARYPDYELDESGVERMRASNVRGLAKLPITISR